MEEEKSNNDDNQIVEEPDVAVVSVDTVDLDRDFTTSVAVDSVPATPVVPEEVIDVDVPTGMLIDLTETEHKSEPIPLPQLFGFASFAEFDDTFGIFQSKNNETGISIPSKETGASGDASQLFESAESSLLDVNNLSTFSISDVDEESPIHRVCLDGSPDIKEENSPLESVHPGKKILRMPPLTKKNNMKCYSNKNDVVESDNSLLDLNNLSTFSDVDVDDESSSANLQQHKEESPSIGESLLQSAGRSQVNILRVLALNRSMRMKDMKQTQTTINKNMTLNSKSKAEESENSLLDLNNLSAFSDFEDNSNLQLGSTIEEDKENEAISSLSSSSLDMTKTLEMSPPAAITVKPVSRIPFPDIHLKSRASQ